MKRSKRIARPRPADEFTGNDSPNIPGRLHYPLPSRNWHATHSQPWTKPAVLAAIAAGGWFDKARSYYWADQATALYASTVQAFFDALREAA